MPHCGPSIELTRKELTLETADFLALLRIVV
jgi:hypothetical protein